MDTGAALAPVAATTDLELQLLLEAVVRVSGFDLRDYAPGQIRRRIADRMRAEEVETISGLQERVLHAPGALERLIDAVTFNASAPFRDPGFFRDLATRIIPRLRTFPYIRVWVAGCGAADDAYALAILFHEADLGRRVRIYATDVTESAIERARRGIIAADEVREAAARYVAAGGTANFEDYLTPAGADFTYGPLVREHIILAQHNLATDGSFNEFHLVLARTVLGQFNRTLSYRAHQVIYESLVRLGYLALGEEDSLRATPHQRAYESFEAGTVFRRIR